MFPHTGAMLGLESECQPHFVGLEHVCMCVSVCDFEHACEYVNVFVSMYMGICVTA